MRRLVRSSFLLVLPLLVWNLVFWPRLPMGAGGTDQVPLILEWLESGLRLLVFGLPVFLVIREPYRLTRLGWTVYGLGLLLYFSSWAPWLRGVERQNVLLLLGPHVTPAVVLVGIAILSRSRTFAAVSIVFIVVHGTAGLMRGGVW